MITFHGLRHKFATSLIKAGVPLKYVAESLGAHVDCDLRATTGTSRDSHLAVTIRADNLPSFGFAGSMFVRSTSARRFASAQIQIACLSNAGLANKRFELEKKIRAAPKRKDRLGKLVSERTDPRHHISERFGETVSLKGATQPRGLRFRFALASLNTRPSMNSLRTSAREEALVHPKNGARCAAIRACISTR